MKPTDPRSPRDSEKVPAAHTSGAHHGSGAHGEDDLQNETVAHEQSDVNVRAILGFAGIVAGVTIVCGLLMWGLFNFFEGRAVARDPRMSPLAIPATRMPATTTGSPIFGPGQSQQQPQLLTNEPAALRALRETENAQLEGFGWVDQAGGVARVPIADAKRLIAERGLPSRAEGSDPLLGTNAPAYGEASGGRSVPTRAQAGAAPADGQKNPAGSPAAPQAPQEPSGHAPAGRGGGA
jgi:hypothetical protein